MVTHRRCETHLLLRYQNQIFTLIYPLPTSKPSSRPCWIMILMSIYQGLNIFGCKFVSTTFLITSFHPLMKPPAKPPRKKIVIFGIALMLCYCSGCMQLSHKISLLLFLCLMTLLKNVGNVSQPCLMTTNMLVLVNSKINSATPTWKNFHPPKLIVTTLSFYPTN